MKLFGYFLLQAIPDFINGLKQVQQQHLKVKNSLAD
jgi:hypothetical protein